MDPVLDDSVQKDVDSGVGGKVQLNPVECVVAAAHADKLSQRDLEFANVLVPEVTDENVSTPALLDHLSDLIADAWPEPSTAVELQDLLYVAAENLGQAVTTTTTTTHVETDNQNFDSAEDLPPLPGAPPNETFGCVSVESGDDNIVSSKGKPIRLHFFHGSGNVEIRKTSNGNTRSDVVALESLYSMWMTQDTVNLVLSCPTTARTLTKGRSL